MSGATAVWIFGALIFAAVSDADTGSIEGIVINGSRGDAPAAGVDVALRVRVDGRFVGLARTTSGPAGEFRFEQLPTDLQVPYLPGASQGEVHFPGPRVLLSPDHPQESLTLTVYDAITEPNPLQARMEMIVEAEPGLLRIQETMFITNPTRECYVGQAMHQGANAVTLRLAIPADFERVTFDEESLGRSFALVDEKLVTSIPWPPGERQVRYTYVMANEQQHRVWERALDLPCSQVKLTVRTDAPNRVICSLPVAPSLTRDQVSFEAGQPLPAGHPVRVELGQLPVPMMVYARWCALLTLGALILGVSYVSTRHPRKLQGPPPNDALQAGKVREPARAIPIRGRKRA